MTPVEMGRLGPSLGSSKRPVVNGFSDLRHHRLLENAPRIVYNKIEV